MATRALLTASLSWSARELTVFQRTAAYAAPARNGPLDAELEARVKADYAGFRARNRRMHGGFGSLLPPNPMSALAVMPGSRRLSPLAKPTTAM